MNGCFVLFLREDLALELAAGRSQLKYFFKDEYVKSDFN